jgi:hypothetical protein
LGRNVGLDAAEKRLSILLCWGSNHPKEIPVHEGGKDVSHKYRPSLPPREISGTHFCKRGSRAQGNSAAGRVTSIKILKDPIGNYRAPLLSFSSFCTLISSVLMPLIALQHTTDKHPCPRRDSNPQPQQTIGRRPSP